MSFLSGKRAGSVVVVVCASILGTMGCSNKKDGEKGPEPTADKAPEQPAAAPGCSEKAYKHTNPDFCLDVPAGFEAKPEEKRSTGFNVKFDAGDDEWFSISWGRWPTAEEAIEAYKSREEGSILVAESDLAGGGYFTHYQDPPLEGEPESFTIAAIAKGTKAYVLCFAGTEQKDLVATLVSACKAVRVD
jgi:hypothetical protein